MNILCMLLIFGNSDMWLIIEIDRLQFLPQLISKITTMYRRPMSPYNSRVSTYLEALERDETINSLRREYAHHRSIEAEYDDLNYQISKAERENKKLEEQNISIQEDYMEKIKCNKALIAELGSQIEQVETKIKNTNDHAAAKQVQNEKIIDEIKQTKTKIIQCQQQNKKLQHDLDSQDNVIGTLTKTLDELMGKKKESQSQNKNQSELIDGQFDEYKSLQDRTKAEEVINVELREQVNILKAKKTKLQLKVEQVQDKIKDLKKKYEHCEFEKDKTSLRCQETEKQSSKVYAEALTLKENIEQSLTKNKDHTAKLKSLQVVLKENINGLTVKHSTKQKMAVELSNLTKDIQKAQTVIHTLDKETEDQQSHNKGLIQNLKKSIQSDEEAVKALTRKAAILNLISQS